MTYLHQDQNQMSTREREKRITENIKILIWSYLLLVFTLVSGSQDTDLDHFPAYFYQNRTYFFKR